MTLHVLEGGCAGAGCEPLSIGACGAGMSLIPHTGCAACQMTRTESCGMAVRIWCASGCQCAIGKFWGSVANPNTFWIGCIIREWCVLKATPTPKHVVLHGEPCGPPVLITSQAEITSPSLATNWALTSSKSKSVGAA